MNKQRLTSLAWDVAYYLIVIGALWYIANRNNLAPLRPWFWHTAMRICHTVAYNAGRAAIRAEVLYGVAIEKVRL